MFSVNGKIRVFERGVYCTHVFLLSAEISPGLVHRFSCVCLWNFQELCVWHQRISKRSKVSVCQAIHVLALWHMPTHMCFCYLLRSHLGLFTDFLVSVCGISRSMVILFFGFSLLCVWNRRIRKTSKVSLWQAIHVFAPRHMPTHMCFCYLPRPQGFFSEPPLVGHRASFFRTPLGGPQGFFSEPPLVGHRARGGGAF